MTHLTYINQGWRNDFGGVCVWGGGGAGISNSEAQGDTLQKQ